MSMSVTSKRSVANSAAERAEELNSLETMMNAGTQILDVGDPIPDFSLDSQVGKIDFHDLIDGKWCLVMTFGSAFDPVTTTDIGMLSRMAMEWEARNMAVVCIGNDSLPNYRKWIKDIEEIQAVRVNIPVLSDTDNMKQMRRLGCAKYFPVEETVKQTSCGAFLVDLDRNIRYSSRYPTTVGRNWYEVLRTFDALQLTDHQKCVCPSNWGQGQDILLSTDITKDESTLFRFTEIKPWFKLAPCP
jgi:alkyl hydroperoxide reductase subunit AhpC